MKLHPIQNVLALWMGIEMIYGICMIYFGTKRASEEGIKLIGFAEVIRAISIRMTIALIPEFFYVSSGYRTLSHWNEGQMVHPFEFLSGLNVYLAVFILSIIMLVVTSLPNWISYFMPHDNGVKICQAVSLVINIYLIYQVVQLIIHNMDISGEGDGYSYLGNATTVIYGIILIIVLGIFTFRKTFAEMSVPDKILRVGYMAVAIPAGISAVIALFIILDFIAAIGLILLGLFIWLWSRG